LAYLALIGSISLHITLAPKTVSSTGISCLDFIWEDWGEKEESTDPYWDTMMRRPVKDVCWLAGVSQPITTKHVGTGFDMRAISAEIWGPEI
jgi:hypothetical protein